jgi:hypothetical protein
MAGRQAPLNFISQIHLHAQEFDSVKWCCHNKQDIQTTYVDSEFTLRDTV